MTRIKSFEDYKLPEIGPMTEPDDNDYQLHMKAFDKIRKNKIEEEEKEEEEEEDMENKEPVVLEDRKYIRKF